MQSRAFITVIQRLLWQQFRTLQRARVMRLVDELSNELPRRACPEDDKRCLRFVLPHIAEHFDTRLVRTLLIVVNDPSKTAPFVCPSVNAQPRNSTSLIAHT